MYRFESLSNHNQEIAKARFLGAGPRDGYVYSLDVNGQVLSRKNMIYLSSAELQVIN